MNELTLYNEIDDFAADWLESLIRADLIAPGRVDRRSIVDLTPDDLAGYRQVHLCAGIGIWSAALRDAGQRDDAPWWTASCPCQPFSAAGKGNGFADERHLWPATYHLVSECRPSRIVGEQVASPDGLHWLDLVSSDMEAARYAFGASDLCAPGVQVPAGETTIGRETIEWIRGAILTCPDPQLAADLRDYAEWFEREVGIGAPHIRQRLFWLANADCARRREGRPSEAGVRAGSPRVEPAGFRTAGTMADPNSRQRDGITSSEGRERNGAQAGWQQSDAEGLQRSWQYGQQPPDGCAGELGHADNTGSQGRIKRRDGRDERPLGSSGLAFFSECDWIVCTDGQARPVEIGTFPLASREPNRVGKLRAYGNQIFRPLATQFILAATEALQEQPR